ncbi:hypothetical protein Goshw_010528 [Gossypium schwendimanii]|uniref:Uncharacterized protein n=1 Tax=Gossypium schwendimanii TaxID=34291 RepID=A0A7J9M2P7_GOSSC|nr:hypothetical protein [Gossypium schwendimanii]
MLPSHIYRINPGSNKLEVELLPETRAFFQGAIFQKHHYFSTLGSNNTSGGGDEQKETISVTFVSKDGEEIPIRVPIGTSMLEAAHQNDIELEGKAYDILSRLGCQIIARPELDGIRLAIPAATRNFAVDGYVAKPH